MACYSDYKSCPFEYSAEVRKIRRSPVCALSISVPILIKVLPVEGRPDHCPADHDGVIERGGEFTHPGVWISRHAQLPEGRSDVEIRPLTDHLLSLELEDDDQAEVDLPSGRGQAAPVPAVGPGKPSFHDHGFGRVMEGLRVKAEIREALLVFLEESVDARMAIPHLPGRDDLVPRMREHRDAALEVMCVLSLHMLEHGRLTLLPNSGITHVALASTSTYGLARSSTATRFRAESNPTGFACASTTGRCLMPRLIILSATTLTSSSAVTVAGSGVMITSAVACFGLTPSAITRTRSRSVMMPTSRPSDMTATESESSSPIWRATSARLVPGSTASRRPGGRSLTFTFTPPRS